MLYSSSNECNYDNNILTLQTIQSIYELFTNEVDNDANILNDNINKSSLLNPA